MDPPPPPIMDRVHGPPIFAIPKITDVNNDKIKIRKLKKKNEFTVMFQININ